MREVDHVHQAEHQRQARGHHEDHHAHREAGDGERDPGREAADERQRGERDQRSERVSERDPRCARGASVSFTGAPPATGRAGAAAALSSAASAAIVPACTMRPESITATVSPSERAKWKFCSTTQERRVGCLSSRERLDHVVDDRRREALGRLVDQQQLAAARRWRARWRASASARRRGCPAAASRNFFIAGNRRKIHSRRCSSSAPVARGEHQVLVHRQAGEDAHVLRHVGDAEARDVRACRASCDLRGRRSGSLPAEARHRPMMVRRQVVLPAPLRPSSMVSSFARHLEDPRPAGCGTGRCAC